MKLLIATLLILLTSSPLLANDPEPVGIPPLVSFDLVFDNFKTQAAKLITENVTLLLSMGAAAFLMGLIGSFLSGRVERAERIRKRELAVSEHVQKMEMREEAKRVKRLRETGDSRTDKEKEKSRRDWLFRQDMMVSNLLNRDDVAIQEIQRTDAEIMSTPAEMRYYPQYYDEDGDVEQALSEFDMRYYFETDEEFIEKYFNDHSEIPDSEYASVNIDDIATDIPPQLHSRSRSWIIEQLTENEDSEDEEDS